MPAGTLEYHLLTKRVATGKLSLGSLVDSLENLKRVNAGEEPKITGDRIDHFYDIDVEISKEVVLGANANIAVKAVALEGAGGEASVNGERNLKDSYTIPRIHTQQFDPEQPDYEKAIASEKAQKFLKATKYHPVYMITGLKLGTRSSVDSTRKMKMEGKLEAGVHTEGVSVGSKAGASRSVAVTQKGEELTETVLAIRVQKIRYEKTGFLGLTGSRAVTAEASNNGAELAGDNRKALGAVTDSGFRAVEEEMENYVKVPGAGVVWLVPKP